MKKRVFVSVIISIFLALTTVDCFAQNIDARTRELQGEWVLLSLQIGTEIMDFTEPPYVNTIKMIIIFENNNYLQKHIYLQTGLSQIAETGIFQIIADELVLTLDDGRSQAFQYTIQGKRLTMRMNFEGNEIIMTYLR
jgi:hypothetical protein